MSVRYAVAFGCLDAHVKQALIDLRYTKNMSTKTLREHIARVSAELEAGTRLALRKGEVAERADLLTDFLRENYPRADNAVRSYLERAQFAETIVLELGTDAPKEKLVERAEELIAKMRPESQVA